MENKMESLGEDFLDVGYMGEDFVAVDLLGKDREIKRSDKEAMKIFIALPHPQELLQKELLIIDSFLAKAKVPMQTYVVFKKNSAAVQDLSKSLKTCEILIDSYDEFGGMYGVVSSSDDFFKALFLLGKEGAIYYVQTPESFATPFDLALLQIHLNKTYLSYTTKSGCHG